MLPQFPPRPFLGPFIRRVGAVWAFIRAISVFGGAAVSRQWGVAVPGSGLLLGPYWLAGLVVGVVVFLILFDLTRRSEMLFLQNLGRSPARLGVAVAALCVAFEALLRGTVG